MLSGDGAHAGQMFGAVFHSNLFPGRAPTGTSVVSCGFRGEEVGGLPDAALVRRAVEGLRSMLGPAHAPEGPRVAAQWVHKVDVPSPSVGHNERMDRLRRHLQRALPGVFLAGSYLGSIGVAGRLDHARRLAETVRRSLQHQDRARR